MMHSYNREAIDVTGELFRNNTLAIAAMLRDETQQSARAKEDTS